MDTTLERILSLLPHKPNGELVHGAKSEFAKNIGYTDGHIVSMWEKGSSDSYKQKLYEISSKYGVSVAWLKGETDEKKPSLTEEDELIGCLDLLRTRPEFRGLLYAAKSSPREEVEAFTKLIEVSRYFRNSKKILDLF